MKKSLHLTNNGIQKLLNMININREEDIDMYFKLIDSKLLEKSSNLYICKLQDNNSIYEYFILKSSKKILTDSIIRVTKIRISLSGKNKIISCLHYQNYGKINEEQKDDDAINIEKEKEKEKKMIDEELNENTKMLLGNVKLKKAKAKQFFKLNNDKLILIDQKDRKISNKKKDKKVSGEKTPKKEPKLSDIKNDKNNNNDNKDISYINDDIGILQENEKEIKIKDNNEDEDEDEKEIQNIFKNINIDEIFNINQTISKKNEEYQLIVNLSKSEKGKVFYTKCIDKTQIGKDKQQYLLFIFRDIEGTEINAYAYGNDIKIMNKKIEKNGVYKIFNYLIKPKIASSFINCDFRLILTSKTDIELMPHDPIFNSTTFHFLSIEELFFFKTGTIVDICGIIYDGGKPEPTKTINGNKLIRNILICDTSRKKINIAVWEPHCKNKEIKFEKGEIIAIKYCKIMIYPEKIKKLATTTISKLQNTTNDYEKDKSLKDFYNKYKSAENFSLVLIPPEFQFIEELKTTIDNNIKNNIKNCNISFLTKGYVADIPIDNKCLYKGCHFCNKKLGEINKNNNRFKYNCFQCKRSFEKPKYIFQLLFKIRDACSTIYCKMIGNIAEKFLEISPNDVNRYLEEKNYSELQKIEKRVCLCEYLFFGKLQSKEYNNKIYNNARIFNFEKADGDNFKKFFEIMKEE